MANACLETSVGRDIDVPTEKALKLELQTTQIEEATSFLHLYEEIYVTPLVGLASGDRAEDPHIPCAVPRANPNNLFPSCRKNLINTHGRTPTSAHTVSYNSTTAPLARG